MAQTFDEIQTKNKEAHFPHLLQAQLALALLNLNHGKLGIKNDRVASSPDRTCATITLMIHVLGIDLRLAIDPPPPQGEFCTL